MKTRTLLLLSVGVALMILMAGGVLLFQLSSQETVSPAAKIGELVQVGDVGVTVLGFEVGDGVVRIDVEVGGVQDSDGIASFRLVTGDQRLDPIASTSDGRCSEIVVAPQRCTIDFDVTASESSNRVLVLRRGEEQSTWRLS